MWEARYVLRRILPDGWRKACSEQHVVVVVNHIYVALDDVDMFASNSHCAMLSRRDIAVLRNLPQHF